MVTRPFEDDLGGDVPVIVDLYNEKSGILDVEQDTEIDRASQAYPGLQECN